MMDWSDDPKFGWLVRNLHPVETACRSLVAALEESCVCGAFVTQQNRCKRERLTITASTITAAGRNTRHFNGPPCQRGPHDGLHGRSQLQLTRQRLALGRKRVYQFCHSYSRRLLGRRLNARGSRYLHDVFQDSGRTVSETLLKLRLEKRHKDLADPQLAPCSNLRLSIDQSDPCVPSNA